jgi:large subunit ribosomal protein L23
MTATAFKQERLMQIIAAPIVSEKSTFIGEKHNQIILEVAADATKPEIKAAVELMWADKKIEVTGVKVVNVHGKNKRFGRFTGKRAGWKKAYVSIKAGQEINFAAGE